MVFALILIIAGALSIVLFLLCVFLVWSTVIGGIPYLGTPAKTVEDVVRVAHIKPGERTVDLGAGDGRLVIAFAQAGAKAVGYEINPFFVFLANLNIYRAGVSKNAKVYWQNFFDVDLSLYDIIVTFCIPYTMNRLEKKIEQTAGRNARIISVSFPFVNHKPVKKIGSALLYRFSK